MATGQQLINEINDVILDDEIGDDALLSLINFVRNMIEAEREWIFLQKEDTSITFTPANTYKTAKDLPSDFVLDLKLYLGIEANDDYLEYFPCQFKDRRMFKDSQRYCIDWANSKMYILGSVAETKTAFLEYIYQTDDITISNSPVWPSKFHQILSFLPAAIQQKAIDTDDLTLRQALGLSEEGNKLYKSLVDWDSNIRLRAQNNQAGFKRSYAGARTDRVIDRVLRNT